MPQLSHLKAFFPSWTEATCLFTLTSSVNLVSQSSHLNGFFPSWIDEMCASKRCLLAKLLPQWTQLNGFFPSWTHLMCPCKLVFSGNSASQISHLCGPSCIKAMCLLILFWLEKIFLQKLHVIGRIKTLHDWNELVSAKKI